MDYRAEFHSLFDEQALFLPSIFSGYVNGISKEVRQHRPGFAPTRLYSTQELNFLDQEHGMFFYPWALYSAGVANLNMERAVESESAIYQRDRENTFLMVDSGGFQIITGNLRFDWNNPDNMRLKILRWQEAIGNVAIVLDVPTDAIYTAGAPFNSFDDCLHQTIENLQFISDNATGKVPFINVIQGQNNREVKQWYDAVKFFECDGWALAGAAKKDLYTILRTIIMLRDDKALEQCRWLHFLGVGNTKMGVILSAIQRGLREWVNSDIQVTLDAATPFQEAGLRGEMRTYWEYADDKRMTRAVKERFEGDLPFLNPEKPFPNCRFSPVLGEFPVKDVFVREGNGWRERPSDALTYTVIMAHNVYALLEEFMAANAKFTMDGTATYLKMLEHGQNKKAWMNDEEVERSGVDWELMTCVVGIGAVLQSETPMTELNELKQMMENF